MVFFVIEICIINTANICIILCCIRVCSNSLMLEIVQVLYLNCELRTPIMIIAQKTLYPMV